MTLRLRILLTLIIVLVPLLLIIYLVLRSTTLNGYASIEQDAVTRNLDRATNTLQNNANNLGRMIHDWASSDAIYTAMQQKQFATIDPSLTDNMFWALHINVMMVVDNQNQILDAKVHDLDPEWDARLLPTFEDYAQSDPRFLRVMTDVSTSGYVDMGGVPMLVASRPILRSDNSGPRIGTLIWAQRISDQELTTISSALRLMINLQGIDAPDLPDGFRSETKILSPSVEQNVVAVDDDTVDGYALLEDIYDQPTLMVQTSQVRSVYELEQRSLRDFAIALGIGGLVLGSVLLLLVDRLILARLKILSKTLQQMSSEDRFTMRVEVVGSDEIAQFTSVINRMLTTITLSREAQQQLAAGLERRASERELEVERQKSQLQVIMDTMGEGLVYTVDGIITFTNRAFVELLGYQASDLISRPFALLSDQTHSMDTPILSHVPERYDATLTRKDGSSVSVAMTATPVDEDDEHRRRVIIVRDITGELAVKQQRDYFFARASHDLRTPLASLMSRVYLLEKKPDQLETHLKALDYISNQMYQLVNDLLDVARVDQGTVVLEQRNLVLQSIIDEIIEIETADAELKMISLCSELTETPLQVYGDPMRLKQVVANLVSNAIHYTPSGGHIRVKVEQEAAEDQPRAVISVCDDGIGISEENLIHVFEPFFRVNKNNGIGSGLGLYIVKEIVELHNGKINVQSELGKGTTFTVWLALSNGAL